MSTAVEQFLTGKSGTDQPQKRSAVDQFLIAQPTAQAIPQSPKTPWHPGQLIGTIGDVAKEVASDVLDVPAMPGDYLRGLAVGKPGKRITPTEMTDIAFEPKGGWREPWTPTVMSTAATLADPVAASGAISQAVRKAAEARKALPTIPRPSIAKTMPQAQVNPIPHPQAAPSVQSKPTAWPVETRQMAQEPSSLVPEAKAGESISVPPIEPPGSPPIGPDTNPTGAVWQQHQANAWQWMKDKFPAELPLITRLPNSPVISDLERHGVQNVTRLGDLLKQDLTQAIWKYSPDEWLAAEQKAVSIWTAGGRTPEAYETAIQSLPGPFQQMLRYRQQQFAADQAARAELGLEALPENPGPYFPRLTDQDARGIYEVYRRGSGLKQDLQTTVKSFQKERRFETAVDGQVHGIRYEDPRKAWLMREWHSIKLQETAQLMREMKGKVLFDSREEALAASPVREAIPIEGLPGTKDRYWATSKEEALFLKQNIINPEGGLTGSIHLVNQMFRNPNLINPLPHVVKNMYVKYAMARGSLNPAPLLKDVREYFSNGNPQMIHEFQQVMPFTPHGETAYQMMEPYVGVAIRKSLSHVGDINKLSSKFIFAYADPGMRYSLWKYYRTKGLTPQESANNVWVDLIRYGTRSELVDTWKAIPFNFFVPWRIGSYTALAKQATGAGIPERMAATGPGALQRFATGASAWAASRPLKTGLVLGTIEYLREAHYRQTGRTFHIPADYVDGPLTKIVDDPAKAIYIASTFAMFGPGGDIPAKNISQALNVVRGTENWNKVKEMFWGIGQVYGAGADTLKAIEQGDAGAMMSVLRAAALSEHDSYGYRPEHMARYLPDWMPAMEKQAIVEQAEQRRDALKRRGELKRTKQEMYREADRQRAANQ